MGCGCDISAHGLHDHLQTAITSSFQLQITYRLSRFNSKLCTVWSIGLLTSRDSKRDIVCIIWDPVSAPKCIQQLRNGVRLWHFRSTLHVHLQTTITFLLQLQIAHRLKRWTLEFPSFKTKYSMHNLSSRKCSKMCPNSSKMGVRLRHFRSWCAQSSSNSHNFFVSTPNRALFEALDS